MGFIILSSYIFENIHNRKIFKKKVQEGVTKDGRDNQDNAEAGNPRKKISSRKGTNAPRGIEAWVTLYNLAWKRSFQRADTAQWQEYETKQSAF